MISLTDLSEVAKKAIGDDREPAPMINRVEFIQAANPHHVLILIEALTLAREALEFYAKGGGHSSPTIKWDDAQAKGLIHMALEVSTKEAREALTEISKRVGP